MTLSVGSVLTLENSEGTAGRRFAVARIKYSDPSYAYPNPTRISYEIEMVTLE